MSLIDDNDDYEYRVGSDAHESTINRRHEDLGTSENPIILCGSPVDSVVNTELSIGRTQSVSRTSRRKCPLGAYVEIIEESRPVRATSLPSCNVAANLSGDFSQDSPSETLEVNRCLSVPHGFEILMRCSICMEIFHNPANISPCNHKFCYSCLLSWKRSNQTAVCPQVRCRGPIHSMQKDPQFNEVVESFLITNPNKRRSSTELEALDAMEADYITWQNRGHSRSRRRGSVPQTRNRASRDRTIRSPFVIRVSQIRAHRAPLTNRQRGQHTILEDWFTV